ncbi:DNA polymerase III subunit chi [Rhizosaccharibacter radicis]|uniref:DNA polymerase III subunit chi n=1 Tax=Rhizosaccharibacter radicis TaxID=2782605 RepID=A0ABT1VXA3_9PROT|nr:DNA polymerase III subunit chi [Acetobacteraceae bacterium KSS12]
MAEVGFYHLTRTGPEQALPRLLGRTLEAGKRAVVRCRDEEQVRAIDEALWRAPEPPWLPHGTAALGFPELQPVWITADDEQPNGGSFLFLLDDVPVSDPARFERVFVLFDGNDDPALAAARRRWASWRDEGHALTYWRQEAGGWVRAA